MKLSNIKKCVDNNIPVYYSSEIYEVRYDKVLHEYYVICTLNNNIQGLCYKTDSNKCTHDLDKFFIGLPF